MKKIIGAIVIAGLLGGYGFISKHKVNDNYIQFNDGTGYYSETPIFKIF